MSAAHRKPRVIGKYKYPPLESERDLKRTIVDYLNTKRFFWWPCNSGAFKRGGHVYWFGLKGAPDLFVLRYGVLFGLELKVKNNDQSQAQRVFQSDMERNGARYVVARRLQDVVDLFEVSK